jgi:hypothetical protein
MAEAGQTSPTMAISDKQFKMSSRKRKVRSDPHNGNAPKRGKFSGGPGEKKTMDIDKPKLPKAPESHPHRRHAAKRTRRAH